MRRAHRHWHRGLWLVLAPAAVAVVVLALLVRPAPPAVDRLPAALQGEAE